VDRSSTWATGQPGPPGALQELRNLGLATRFLIFGFTPISAQKEQKYNFSLPFFLLREASDDGGWPSRLHWLHWLHFIGFTVMKPMRVFCFTQDYWP
jgi:hypothetical protein